MLTDATSASTGDVLDLRSVCNDFAVQWVVVQNAPDSNDQVQAVPQFSLDGDSWWATPASLSIGATTGTAITSGAGIHQVVTNRPARYVRVKVSSVVGDLSVSAVVASRP